MNWFDRGQLLYDRGVAVFYLVFCALCAVSAIRDIVDAAWDLMHTGIAILPPLVNDVALPPVTHPTAFQSAVHGFFHLPRLPFVLLFCVYSARVGIERWIIAGLAPRDDHEKT